MESVKHLSNPVNNEPRPSVNDLRTLLGADVVMVPVPSGTKRPVMKGWTELTLSAMSDPAHLRKLEHGNVGVLMGQPSAGLCSIDCDSEDFLQAVLQVNCCLENSLVTCGQRGGNIWIRCQGQYPDRVAHLKDTRGNQLGEFRSTGGQTIVCGIHPSGQPYRMVHRAPPVRTRYSQIRWPPGVIPPILASGCLQRETERFTERTEPTERAEEVENFEVFFARWRREKEALLKTCIPCDVHQNHAQLFRFARLIKGTEGEYGRRFRDEELQRFFDVWIGHSKRFLRPRHYREDYLIEFLDGLDRVKNCLEENPLVKAWQRTKTAEVPAVSRQFQNPDLRLVVGLCRELQREAGAAPFYLGCRSIAKLSDDRVSHTTASQWLRHLVRVGILRVAEKGGPETNKATRFYYAGSEIPETTQTQKERI